MTTKYMPSSGPKTNGSATMRAPQARSPRATRASEIERASSMSSSEPTLRLARASQAGRARPEPTPTAAPARAEPTNKSASDASISDLHRGRAGEPGKEGGDVDPTGVDQRAQEGRQPPRRPERPAGVA